MIRRLVQFQHSVSSPALSTFAMNFSIRSGQLRFFSGSQVSSLWENPFQWIRNSRDPFFLKWTSITLSTYAEYQSHYSYLTVKIDHIHVNQRQLLCFQVGENLSYWLGIVSTTHYNLCQTAKSIRLRRECA